MIFLKYTAATVILTAICLHSFDIYPLGVIVHFIGAILWTIVGIKWREGSILLNFVPQIFILGSGLIFYLIKLS